MTLQARVDYFSCLFELLQYTNSRLEKESIVRDIPDEVREDFDYILECLAGKHKFGYKYYRTIPVITPQLSSMTVKKVLQFLQTPMITHDLSEANIQTYVEITNAWYEFFAPIVNRTLRLGIGQSVLPKDALSPMLAKKFEGTAKYDKDGYYITEKLDGNRCIAHYENGKWQFTSRSGKPMHVNFDMSGLDERLIYDGEILSHAQLQMSLAIEDKVKYDINPNTIFSDTFSSTSGEINRHSVKKSLVYNIFDVMDGASYSERRRELDNMTPLSTDVRILPVLKHFKTQEELQESWGILNSITDIGGEGLMINLGQSEYLHKRTDQVLKLKKVHTIDMQVYSYELGRGKYEGMIGALEARAMTEDGKEVYCSVGTGLSDEQRERWALHPEEIVGKIIEVSYFSLSQSKEDRERSTGLYSLRFPRLKKVRFDKNETSMY